MAYMWRLEDSLPSGASSSYLVGLGALFSRLADGSEPFTSCWLCYILLRGRDSWMHVSGHLLRSEGSIGGACSTYHVGLGDEGWADRYMSNIKNWFVFTYVYECMHVPACLCPHGFQIPRNWSYTVVSCPVGDRSCVQILCKSSDHLTPDPSLPPQDPQLLKQNLFYVLGWFRLLSWNRLLGNGFSRSCLDQIV